MTRTCTASGLDTTPTTAVPGPSKSGFARPTSWSLRFVACNSYLRTAPTLCARLFVSLSPCLLVSLSPCLLVSLSPCLPVSLSPCLLVSLSPCLLVSSSPCLPVSLSPRLLVSSSPCLLVAPLHPSLAARSARQPRARPCSRMRATPPCWAASETTQ